MEAELLLRFKPINHAIWELPKTYRKKLKVPVRIVATKKLLEEMDDGAVDQAINVAQLPGIIEASFVMPDAHWGYGFPIGGVAAFDLEEGVISPGGIGFDINCGMRLLVTNLSENEVRPKIKKLVDRLFEAIPTGVGAQGVVRLSPAEFKEVMQQGGRWAIKQGMGWEEDKEAAEEGGAIPGADPDTVSERAIQRGISQLGTLGSGNHYLEVQRIEKVFAYDVAKELGIEDVGQVAIMIHCGSRGFGHQVATDFLRVFERVMKKYGISVPDRQLACAPASSPEGKKYYAAMICAANNAFCNRQVIAHRVREVFSEVFGKDAKELGMRQVYDVAHNIAKIEEHMVEQNGKGKKKKVLVHRKGATRSFPGQPVIIGGSMETGSYLLAGTQGAMDTTFGSTAHGSGRTMSRTKAKKLVRGQKLQQKMQEGGIYVRSASYAGLAEEAGFAYKDISEVVRAVEEAGISKPVVSFTPLGNIKG